MTLLDEPASTGTPVASAPVPLEPAPSPARRSRRGVAALVVVVAGILVGAAVVVGLLVATRAGDSGVPAGSSYGVVIQPGTAKRIASGFHLFIIPTDLQLHVGDSLVITNDDVAVHEVGPFFVRPGETLVHRFTEPGSWVGNCTFHPVGQVKIEVFPQGTPIAPPSVPPQLYN